LEAAGCEAHLVCSKPVHDRLRGVGYAASSKAFHFGRGGGMDLREAVRVRNHLVHLGVDTVVLNTARGSRVRNLLLLPTGPMRFAGLAHIANKLWEGTTRHLIHRKVKRYFVLGDYILPQVRAHTNLQVEGIYLLTFPPTDPRPVNKPEGEFWVVIPGQVEFKKRAYESLIDRISARIVDPRIKFLLLGSGTAAPKDNRDLRDYLDARGLTQRFRLFTDFVDHDTFHNILDAADLVLPLIHPSQPEHQEYLRYKVSFAFSLAFGHGVPMLCEESFQGIDDFDTSAAFYRERSLAERLDGLARRPEELAAIRERMKSYNKFNFETQRRRYMSLLESDD